MNNNEMFVEIIPALGQSLAIFEDISTDFIELSVDAILQDGLLKDIPIVGAFSSILKFGHSIHDRNLLKQTLIFIKTINDGSISKEKLEKYKNSLAKNSKKAEKELGRTVLFLNRHIEYIQSISLAKFHQAYIDQKISWEQFGELAMANDRMFALDYQILHSIYETDGIEDYSEEIYQIDRLASLGLISKNAVLGGLDYTVFDGGDASNPGAIMPNMKDITITKFGKLFCKLLGE